MQPWRIVKGAGKAAFSVFWLPWRAVKMNLVQMKEAKEVHRENIVYIRELYDEARGKSKDRKAKKESQVTGSFEDVMNSRGSGAPTIHALQKRFLCQKRLAIGTCTVFVALSGYGLANGSWLAIATLLAALPLFFMAALSAQFRLWQLRTRRLSKDEKGGLHDYRSENPRWYFDVLNPELGWQPGEPP